MILIPGGLRWAPLPKLLRWLSWIPLSKTEDLAGMEKMAGYTDSLLALFPYNKKGNCLPRSLILYALAPRYGFQVKFHCGVRKGEEGLEGHAWITREGQTFLEYTRQSIGMVETFIYPPKCMGKPD